MKILHVISSIDPRHGGVTEGLRQLADVSMELGCVVEAVTLDNPGQAFLEQFHFPIHALGSGWTHFHYNPKLKSWLFDNIQAYEIVVVHGLWQYHSVAVRQAARKRKVPYVIYTHGMLDPYFKRTYPLKHARKWLFWPWADYRVLRDADAVLFTTEEERRLARESFWLYSAKEAVVNLGTRRPEGNAEQQRAHFYARHPELKGKRLALFLGRLHHKKGCDLAIRAFAQALGADADWQLVMAGPDQTGWRRVLEQLGGELNMAGRITWTGMIDGDEKWGALRAAEFFFLPSHQENFGVAVAEALACGVPALISNKVNIWREVEELSAGLVASDTLEGATQLLTKWVALGADGQSRMRSNAMTCFDQKFEIHRATSSLLNALHAVLPAVVHKGTYANV